MASASLLFFSLHKVHSFKPKIGLGCACVQNLYIVQNLKIINFVMQLGRKKSFKIQNQEEQSD